MNVLYTPIAVLSNLSAKIVRWDYDLHTIIETCLWLLRKNIYIYILHGIYKQPTKTTHIAIIYWFILWYFVNINILNIGDIIWMPISFIYLFISMYIYIYYTIGMNVITFVRVHQMIYFASAEVYCGPNINSIKVPIFCSEIVIKFWVNRVWALFRYSDTIYLLQGCAYEIYTTTRYAPCLV